jgi:hypothetical protein
VYLDSYITQWGKPTQLDDDELITEFHVYLSFHFFYMYSLSYFYFFSFVGIILLDRLENVDISLDGDSLGFDSSLPRLRSPGT